MLFCIHEADRCDYGWILGEPDEATQKIVNYRRPRYAGMKAAVLSLVLMITAVVIEDVAMWIGITLIFAAITGPVIYMNTVFKKLAVRGEFLRTNPRIVLECRDTSFQILALHNNSMFMTGPYKKQIDAYFERFRDLDELLRTGYVSYDIREQAEDRIAHDARNLAIEMRGVKLFDQLLERRRTEIQRNWEEDRVARVRADAMVLTLLTGI